MAAFTMNDPTINQILQDLTFSLISDDTITQDEHMDIVTGVVDRLEQKWWQMCQDSCNEDEDDLLQNACFPSFFLAVVSPSQAKRTIDLMCSRAARTIALSDKPQHSQRFVNATEALSMSPTETIFWLGSTVSGSSNGLGRLSAARNSREQQTFGPATLLSAMFAKLSQRHGSAIQVPVLKVKDVLAAINALRGGETFPRLPNVPTCPEEEDEMNDEDDDEAEMTSETTVGSYHHQPTATSSTTLGPPPVFRLPIHSERSTSITGSTIGPPPVCRLPLESPINSTIITAPRGRLDITAFTETNDVLVNTDVRPSSSMHHDPSSRTATRPAPSSEHSPGLSTIDETWLDIAKRIEAVQLSPTAEPHVLNMMRMMKLASETVVQSLEQREVRAGDKGEEDMLNNLK